MSFALPERSICPDSGYRVEILDLIRPHIGVSVATPIYVSAGLHGLCPLLGGSPRHEKWYWGMKKMPKIISRAMGAFLYRLHTTRLQGWMGNPFDARSRQAQDWINIWQTLKIENTHCFKNIKSNGRRFISMCLMTQVFRMELALMPGDSFLPYSRRYSDP